FLRRRWRILRRGRASRVVGGGSLPPTKNRPRRLTASNDAEPAPKHFRRRRRRLLPRRTSPLSKFPALLPRFLSRLFKPSLPPVRYPTRWVDDPEGLREALRAVDASKVVFFDLEADSMHHYHAKICLMQVLAKGTCWLVDPLEVDTDPLLDALAGKPLIGHGLDYDLRMLKRRGFRPASIFDTMLAAQLLGRSAFGLAA